MPDVSTGSPKRTEMIKPMDFSTLALNTLAGKEIKIFTMDRPEYAVDSTIHVSFDMEKVHVFDTESELRLPPGC